MTQNLDGPTIVRWARRAAAGLKDKQHEINTLNVFPIPDSDTGSNMAHTMNSAYGASTSVDPSNTAAVTAALANGAVRGARGNSGVVLSQVLRALADTAARGPVTGTAVAGMLSQAVDFVKGAIASPVEGTVITVLRAAADGAQAGRDSLLDVVITARRAAEDALAKTPEQLPALAQAGVVDAGGRGLVVILQALEDVLTAEHAPSGAEARGAEARGAEASGADATAETHAGEQRGADAHAETAGARGAGAASLSQEIEVMFFFETQDNPEAVETLRALLEARGNSVVIGALSDSAMTVHVHTREAGTIIEQAFGLGTVTDLRLEVLPAVDSAPDGERQPRLPIVALVPSAEACAVIDGTGSVALPVDSEGPRIAEALRAARYNGTETPSPRLVLLSNGHDPAAVIAEHQRQMQEHGQELGSLSVVDTGSIVGGLAAIAVFDPSAEWEDTIDDMADTVSAQRYVNADAQDARSAIRGLLADGGELVTLAYDPERWGSEEAPDSVAELIDAIHRIHPHLDARPYAVPGLGVDLQCAVE